MALTITYDGFGVVADANAISDPLGGTWRELGGGSLSANPDVLRYSGGATPASIGSKYASKSGYTYVDGVTALDFSPGGTEEGQFIYVWVNIQSAGVFDVLANNGFSVMIGSSIGDTYEYRIAGSDDANGWSGGWKLFVIDPTITTGTIVNGTPDISAINTIGVWIDTIISVRAESIFQSQVMCAKGLKVEGTSSTMYDDIVAWCEDYTNRAAGMFQSRGQTYFSLGGLSIHSDSANTLASADGSNIEYEQSEYWNGSAWVTSYPTTANIINIANSGGNTSVITETNIGMAGNTSNKVELDTSLSGVYTKKGGYLKNLSGITAKAGDIFNGVIISKYDAITLGLENYTSCTLDGSSSLTVGATADFANANTINGSSGIASALVTDLSSVASNVFNSSGSNHAVELSSIGGGTMTWDCVTSGFDAGSTGSPVTPTATGNEDIYVNVASGTLTINIATGATIPSVRSAGAIVNVVSGITTFAFTVSPAITGYEYRLYTVTALGSLAGAIEVAGVESAVSASQSYDYTYTVDTPIAVQIISQPDHLYEEEVLYFTLTNSDQNITINLTQDDNI